MGDETSAPGHGTKILIFVGKVHILVTFCEWLKDVEKTWSFQQTQ